MLRIKDSATAAPRPLTPAELSELEATIPAVGLSAAEVALLRTMAGESLPGNAYANAREHRAMQLKRTMQFPGPTLSFDFDEQQGSSVYEKLHDRAATLNAGSVSWSASRGVVFLGTGAFQFPANTIDVHCGEICDLSTLAPGDAITLAMVYQHKATLGGQHPLFYYGCSGENTCGGWGLVARANGKLFFYHRAVGSSAEWSKSLANRDPGDNGNTLTAVCLEIRINPVDPNYFEIAYADRPIEVAANINSMGFSCNGDMPIRGTGGTGPAKYSTLGPVTLGGKPGTTYTNLTPQLAGNGGELAGLKRLHVQRYKWVPGRYQMILEDLAEKPSEVPTALFLEA